MTGYKTIYGTTAALGTRGELCGEFLYFYTENAQGGGNLIKEGKTTRKNKSWEGSGVKKRLQTKGHIGLFLINSSLNWKISLNLFSGGGVRSDENSNLIIGQTLKI